MKAARGVSQFLALLVLSNILCSGSYGADTTLQGIQARINRLHGEKKFSQAVEYALKNMKFVKKQYGADSLEYANYLTTLGGLYVFAEEDAKARPYFQKAGAIREKNKLPGPPLGIGTEGFFLMIERAKGQAVGQPEAQPQQGQPAGK